MKRAISIIVTLALLAWLASDQRWKMVGDAFASITPGAFVAVAAALFVTYVLRALRVCDEFRDDVNGRFGATLRIILIHNAMINIVPFRGGETAFPILLRQVFGVSIVRAGASLLWFRLQDAFVVGVLACLVWPGLHPALRVAGIAALIAAAWYLPRWARAPHNWTAGGGTGKEMTAMNVLPIPASGLPEGAVMPEHKLSIVIPMYNEADNVEPLLVRIHQAMENYSQPWEVVLVDDGSTDATPAEIRRLAAQYRPHVHGVELVRNYKQTAAMQAGLDAARGDVIATLDGDLQNDPFDIPRMVYRLLTEDLDLVAGWRKNRQEGFWMRRLPSRIANRLIARVTGVRLNDYGCSLKVFRGSVIRSVRLYGEMHRFIPAWLATVTTPRRISEEVVTHHARIHGQSKYGISRTFRVVLDLVFMFFFMRYRTRPGHFFGGIGIVLGVIGSLILAYLFAIKVFWGQAIGTRPMLITGFFLVIAGLQAVTSGVLAEMLSRIYLEANGTLAYVARPQPAPGEGDGWQWPSKPAVVEKPKARRK
ncbi:glycosyltransferase [Mesorhizobium sp.]|uniref:glycosyltransferase n=2 Tax=Mesorhizobium sp. TaxID=1871066 RepID=UPI0025EB4061|nr:glycosyltransferase [Mesorhizobium sp.]